MKRPEATANLLLDATALTGRSAAHVRNGATCACRLHPATAQALAELQRAARGDGLDIQPVSGFRDFAHQLAIWNGKYRGERPLLDADGAPLDALELAPRERIEAILQWSALPGASRHHWGSDMDVVDATVVAAGHRPQLLPAEYAAGGPFAALGAWLDRHAEDFGFFRPYDIERGGVRPEPWHISHAPVSLPACAALDVTTLGEALAGADVEGREWLTPQLPQLHQRFVRNVGAPRWQAAAGAAHQSRSQDFLK